MFGMGWRGRGPRSPGMSCSPCAKRRRVDSASMDEVSAAKNGQKDKGAGFMPGGVNTRGDGESCAKRCRDDSISSGEPCAKRRCIDGASTGAVPAATNGQKDKEKEPTQCNEEVASGPGGNGCGLHLRRDRTAAGWTRAPAFLPCDQGRLRGGRGDERAERQGGGRALQGHRVQCVI
eukprot:gene7575-biopygen18056